MEKAFLLQRYKINKHDEVEIDNINVDDVFISDKDDNIRMYETFKRNWYNMSDVRKRAFRTYQYYIGNQWFEPIKVIDKNGQEVYMSEHDYIKSQGREPFVQNIIYQISKNLIGQLHISPSKSIVKSIDRTWQGVSDMLSGALDEALEENSINILEPRQFEMFLNSGFLISKVDWQYKAELDKAGVDINSIDYNKIAFNSDLGSRGDNIKFVGEIIDTDINTLISIFARTKEQELAIRKMYPHFDYSWEYGTEQAGEGDNKAKWSFENPDDPSQCRAYFMWERRAEWRMLEHDYANGTLTISTRTEKEIKQENAERIRFCVENEVEPNPKLHLISYIKKYEHFWYYKVVTPTFDCLAEGESPYEHQKHPYTITAYPLLHGRIWGFNETLIDSNRQINRMLSLQDAILGGSAKNLLIVPETAMKGANAPTVDEIADEVARLNGVIVLDIKAGEHMPAYLSGNSAHLGLQDMVNRYIQLILQISGVSQSIQGQRAPAGTPSSLYAQEAQYSQINTKDILNVFLQHKKQRDTDVLSVIRQFKEDGLINDKKDNFIEYSKDVALSAKDVKVRVVQATDTPLYRSIIDDKLSGFVANGLIDLKTYAELSSEPFAEPLLDMLNKREEEQRQTQPLNPNEIQQLQAAQQNIQDNSKHTPEQQALIRQALG